MVVNPDQLRESHLQHALREILGPKKAFAAKFRFTVPPCQPKYRADLTQPQAGDGACLRVVILASGARPESGRKGCVHERRAAAWPEGQTKRPVGLCLRDAKTMVPPLRKMQRRRRAGTSQAMSRNDAPNGLPANASTRIHAPTCPRVTGEV